MEETQKLLDRDLSWLSFNYRVLQEAKDPNVPLYERIKFLAIFSSNLDEFYKVRIPVIRNYKKLRKKEKDKLQIFPKRILNRVQRIVLAQQEEFGTIFQDKIKPDLKAEGIQLISDLDFTPEQKEFSFEYFKLHQEKKLQSFKLNPKDIAPFLVDNSIYLIAFLSNNELGIVDIPSHQFDRFIILPKRNGTHYITYLDDIIRDNINLLFPDQQIDKVISVKKSRDAELYIDDEYEGNLIEKIMHSVHNRNKGLTTRFLFESGISKKHLALLKKYFGLHENDLIPGGRYHNFQDFFSFPNPTKKDHLKDPQMTPLLHPKMDNALSLIDLILIEDQLISVPYQRFNYIPNLLFEAAEDPQVKSIKITLYRITKESLVAKALKKAALNGKEVTAFIEVKARFDEENNFFWGAELRQAGAKVLFSYPGIKVHSKLFIITLDQKGAKREITYLGTGNFNENTARVYADHALLTSDQKLTHEAHQVFDILERKIIIPQTDHLLISPFSLRRGFTALIDKEIANAKKGKEAYIIAKMNSLEDREIVYKLYEASAAGVKIYLIVRGICRLLPGKKGLSENISAISIVDRFLEHTRVYIFANGGKEKMYLASADWMTRNLDRRIELAFPIYDNKIYQTIRHIVELQLKDNTKARWLDASFSNKYVKKKKADEPVRAQIDIYSFFQKKLLQPV